MGSTSGPRGFQAESRETRGRTPWSDCCGIRWGCTVAVRRYASGTPIPGSGGPIRGTVALAALLRRPHRFPAPTDLCCVPSDSCGKGTQCPSRPCQVRAGFHMARSGCLPTWGGVTPIRRAMAGISSRAPLPGRGGSEGRARFPERLVDTAVRIKLRSGGLTCLGTGDQLQPCYRRSGCSWHLPPRGDRRRSGCSWELLSVWKETIVPDRFIPRPPWESC